MNSEPLSHLDARQPHLLDHLSRRNARRAREPTRACCRVFRHTLLNDLKLLPSSTLVSQR